ncbi:hypothetical protein NGB36_02760 [Streptomyces sp. RB6PN25]|uniref:Uncharacterized protein n=1 Tax=Streptomyces humicola TaxID=2953240 RepID=A0ABT1PPD5_9ACTN|nr:hypothetical protein [Streptomyces humicola]MCQ4079548.1 hypothetical protein [Streptomyces humicola]
MGRYRQLGKIEAEDTAQVITAVSGLVTASGGACGGVAALLMARNTRRSDRQPTPPAAE